MSDHCNHRKKQPRSNRHHGSGGLSGARPLGRRPVSYPLAGASGGLHGESERTAGPPPRLSSPLHPRQDAPPDLLFPETHRRAPVLRAQGASRSTVPTRTPHRLWPGPSPPGDSDTQGGRQDRALDWKKRHFQHNPLITALLGNLSVYLHNTHSKKQKSTTVGGCRPSRGEGFVEGC